MQKTHNVTLLQLITTRLCHDITGPIGAINNGVEFIEDDASMLEPAMELISSSAQQAIARVQFFRYIYGVNKDRSEAVDFDDKKTLVNAFYHGSSVNIVWNVTAPLSPLQCQTLFNIIYLSASSLIRGGTVHVSHQPGHTEINAEGTQVKIDPVLREALIAPEVHAPSTKTVQAYYTALLVRDAGAQLQLQCDDTYCRISCTCEESVLAGSM